MWDDGYAFYAFLIAGLHDIRVMHDSDFAADSEGSDDEPHALSDQ